MYNYLKNWARQFYKKATRPYYDVASDCQIPGLGALYLKYFGNSAKQTFVEVGAFDGETVSNTSCLADRGWRGIYIEPIPDYAAACAQRHRHNHLVQVLNFAIGREAGKIELQLAGTLTSASRDTLEVYESLDWARPWLTNTRISVEVRTLDSVLEDSVVPCHFELLVVDVEGLELAVFDGFDLSRWQPKMMIVELSDVHPDFQHQGKLIADNAALRSRITGSGYEEIYRDKINTIFINKIYNKNLVL